MSSHDVGFGIGIGQSGVELMPHVLPGVVERCMRAQSAMGSSGKSLMSGCKERS